ncbi:hypothetical protein M9Y10_022122 [Tritrichomonas musculus]|uniref:Uncharacterized protein n=1 Tax=Tritrichomonas musculus TaxID=1915356 RepID=A0ABR2KRE7_9EUKA
MNTSSSNSQSNINSKVHRFSHSNFNRILFTLGTDFIMHNTTVFQSADNPIADAIWNFAHQNFALYLVSDPSSHFRIRQAAASAVHFNRFATNLFISAADYSFMSIFDYLFFNKQKSWSRSSKERAFKRIMLTLRRNGGVYAELFELIESFASSDPAYDDLLKEPPFNKFNGDYENDLTLTYAVTRKEAFKIIRDELGINPRKQFIDFPIHPTSMRNEISLFDCTLKNGERVTVSIFPPHLQRMRKYDLFPFRIIRNILNIIPSAYSMESRQILPTSKSSYSSLRHRKLQMIFNLSSSQFRLKVDAIKALFDSTVDRLDNNLAKEAKSRMKILNGIIGLDFSLTNSMIARRYYRSINSGDLPIAVPPPLPNFCSDHIMVTLVEPHARVQKLSMKSNFDLARFSTLLYKKTESIVPRIGISNLRCKSSINNNLYENQKDLYSLGSYASLVRIESNKMKSICNLYSNILSNNRVRAYQIARSLDIPSQIASKVLKINRKNYSTYISPSSSNTQKMLKNMTIALLPRNAKVALSGGEAIFALGGQMSRTTTRAARSVAASAESITSALKGFMNSIID